MPKRSHHIKEKIDVTQHNSKSKLCGYIDETVNFLIRECSKIEQSEYKIKHDWEGKVVYWQSCNRLHTNNHTNKGYQHKQEIVLENDMHNIVWDFEIHTSLNPGEKQRTIW